MTKKKVRSKLKKLMSERHPKVYYVTILEEVKYWLAVINREIFEGKLKPFRKITIRRRHKIWAECVGQYATNDHRYCELELNDTMKSKKHLVFVLAHECVHAYQFQEEDKMDHGKNSFLAWKPKLNKFGISLYR